MGIIKVRLRLLTYLLALISASAFAQSTPRIDSLESVKGKDANARTLLALSTEYRYVNHAKARANAEAALKVATENNLSNEIFEAYHQLSLLASLSGDFNSALKYDNSNLEHVLKQKDSAGIASVLNSIGHHNREMQRHDEAYKYLTQSHKVASAIHDSLSMVIALHNVGMVFSDLGQYDIALQHYDFARKMGEKIHDDDGLAYMYDDKSQVYLKTKDYDKAREALTQAAKEIRKRNLLIIEHHVLIGFAKLALDLGEYDKALIYYDSAYELHRQRDNEFGMAESNLGKSGVYLAQGKFKEAEALLIQTSQTAHQLNATRLETDSYRLLSELAEKRGDFKNALVYYKNHKALEDSIFSQEMMQKLYQSQLRFAIEGKDSEIASLTKSKKEQEDILARRDFFFNVMIVVLALSAVLLFSTYRSGQRRIRINKLLMEHQAEIKKRSVELEQLNQVKDKFFSIISHDLRSPMNALAGILDLAEKQHLEPHEFTQLTKELRVQFNHTKTLINNLLDWTLLQMDKLKIHEDKVELHGMVEENFKLLSALQVKNTHLQNLVKPGTIAKADTNMVNLVFRNLILNAIKFTEVGGLVTVGATEKGSFIEVSIADNGVGIAPEVQKILFEKTSGYSTRGTANEKGTGLGLILCKEFVERNGGSIWLESEVGKGSTFFFTLKKA